MTVLLDFTHTYANGNFISIPVAKIRAIVFVWFLGLLARFVLRLFRSRRNVRFRVHRNSRVFGRNTKINSLFSSFSILADIINTYLAQTKMRIFRPKRYALIMGQLLLLDVNARPTAVVAAAAEFRLFGTFTRPVWRVPRTRRDDRADTR